MTAAEFEDFLRIEIRVGRILRAEPSAKAKNPAYMLQIDFGDFGVKTSSAHITTLYSHEQLVGRLVLAVTNFPPRQVADVISEVLVLGIPMTDGEVVLREPERDIPLGSRVL